MCDGETKPQPTVDSGCGSVSLFEKIEDMRDKVCRDSNTGIGYDKQGFSVLSIGRNGDFSANLCKFYGVGNEVPCDLLKSHRFAHNNQRRRMQMNRQLYILCGG